MAFAALTLAFWGVEKNNAYAAPKKAAVKCSLIPEKADCKAFFTTYFYNQKTKRCEKISGCVSSVFNSMAECNRECIDAAAVSGAVCSGPNGKAGSSCEIK